MQTKVRFYVLVELDWTLLLTYYKFSISWMRRYDWEVIYVNPVLRYKLGCQPFTPSLGIEYNTYTSTLHTLSYLTRTVVKYVEI